MASIAYLAVSRSVSYFIRLRLIQSHKISERILRLPKSTLFPVSVRQA